MMKVVDVRVIMVSYDEGDGCHGDHGEAHADESGSW